MECLWISKTGRLTAEQMRITDASMQVSDGSNTYAPTAWTRSGLTAESRDVTIRMPAAMWTLDWDPDLLFRVSVYRCTDEVVGVDTITATVTRIMYGTIVGITFEDSSVVLQVAVLARALQNLVGTQQYSQYCRWDLYGAGCTLDRDDYDISGTLDVVVDEVTLESSSFGSLAANYLAGGTIEIGEHSRLIVAHDEPNERITIAAAFPELPEASDAFTVWPGCSKTAGVCNSKFSNLANFGGVGNLPNGNPAEGVWAGVT